MPLRIKVKSPHKSKVYRQMPRDLQEGLKRAVLPRIGMLVSGTAVRKLQKGGRSGAVYKRRGVTHQASAPGEPPKTDTGTLASATFWKMAGGNRLAVDIISNTPYAPKLEFGPKGRPGEARPYMRSSLAENRKKIRKLVIEEERKVARRHAR